MRPARSACSIPAAGAATVRTRRDLHPSVLILGGLGDIARSMAGVIQARLPEIEVHLADARASESTGPSVHRLPSSDDDAYATELRSLVYRLSPGVILPTNEREIARLAQGGMPSDIADRVLLETREHLHVFGDKLLTHDWSIRNGIPAISTLKASRASEIGFPLLLKPREGSGGKNQTVVSGPSELAEVRPYLTDAYVVQPYVAAATEFTCVAARAGSDIRTLVLERRLHAGRSNWVRVTDDTGVIELAERMAALVKPRHSLNFQFLKSDFGIGLIDVNPRFSSTVAMRDALGFTDLVWSIRRAFGVPLSPFKEPRVGTVVEWADDDGAELVLRDAPPERSPTT